MGTKGQIRKRREQVYQLVLQGIRQTDIANKLGVVPRTIEFDVRTIKKELAKKIDKSMDQIYVQFAESMKLRVRRFWDIATDKNTPLKDKMRALENLRSEDTEAVKRAQIIGLLPKMLPGPEEMAVGQVNNQQINVFQILMNIKEKEQKEVIDVNATKPGETELPGKEERKK